MSELSPNSRAAVLLEIGDRFTNGEWPHYPTKFGFTQEDVADLLRIATDRELDTADPEGPFIWAPTHARRALAQLGAVETIEPLVKVIRHTGGNEDFQLDEMPRVLSMLGLAAFAPLAAHFSDRSRSADDRWTLATAISQLAQRHPATRAAGVALIRETLADETDEDRTLNGALAATLMDLHEVDALPVIRAAYARDAIAYEVAGSIEDIEVEMGVRERPVQSADPVSALIRMAPLGREPGRNAPCTCGSGQKYKKCCMKK